MRSYPETRDGSQHPQRLSELLMAIALATDLGTGQPVGHALRTCYLSVVMAGEMDCSQNEIRTVFQVGLLRFLGCTADSANSAETATLVGGDERAFLASMASVVMGSQRDVMQRFVRATGAGHPVVPRIRLLVRGLADPGGAARSLSTHCEVAAILAHRLRLNDSVVEALAHGYERWDGKGYPSGLRGEDIPLAVRVAIVARDADLFMRAGDDAEERLRQRSGHAYDPNVVQTFLDVGLAAVETFDSSDDWSTVLEAEPRPFATLSHRALDDGLAVFADFVDLKPPWTRGHSPAVADLAEAAASLTGMDAADRRVIRQAGLVHDIGRVGVENGIWDKPGRLTADEWERVRLHSYFTQRILERCQALKSLAELASSHHERLDRSGCHRGFDGEQLPMSARLLTDADVFIAATADRPHRPAMASDQAEERLSRLSRSSSCTATKTSPARRCCANRRCSASIQRPGKL